jgi:D-alanyl-D-alanine carboxypeptidase
MREVEPAHRESGSRRCGYPLGARLWRVRAGIAYSAHRIVVEWSSSNLMPIVSIPFRRAAPLALRCVALVATSLALAITVASPAAGQTPSRIAVGIAVDSIVSSALASQPSAGMSVAVVRGPDTLVLKGYGKADLELGVATPARAVYEIGSVTKQFTAAAILQLQAQGKLSLDDDLTKYLPSYPTQGHLVTLRRLLDHTSGIRGYTEIPEFDLIGSRRLPRDSLVALFSSRPFDFAPGTAMAYNNSAYFLLGLVIEKVSGVPYEAYVAKHLFERAGMTDSRYCSNTAVVPRQVHGYDLRQDTLRLAEYLDFTWPYAAGSLCSTAGDLVAWTQALHGGRILGPAAYRELLTPGTLADGTILRYAKGVEVDSLLGHRAIHHAGGIPGFNTELEYFPDDTLTVVVLANTNGSVDPTVVAQSIASVVVGDRSPTPVAFRGRAADYVGEFRGLLGGTELVVTVSADTAGGLTMQRKGGLSGPLVYLGGETFSRPGVRYTFVREAGRVTALRRDAVTENTIAVRTTAKVPSVTGGR